MQAVHELPQFLRAMLCAERNGTRASRKAGVFIASTWQLLHYITTWETFFFIVRREGFNWLFPTLLLHICTTRVCEQLKVKWSRFILSTLNGIRSISCNSRKERPNIGIDGGETLSLSITKVQSRQHCIWGGGTIKDVCQTDSWGIGRGKRACNMRC